MSAPNKAREWALLRVFKVRGPDGALYLWRLRIVQTPWFGVFLHAIHQPDPDTAVHDHPWAFVSVVLRGSYVEQRLVRGNSSNWFDWSRVRWFNAMRAEHAHRIVSLSRSPVWTLVFVGRRCRDWGFYTRHGWMSFSDYLAAPDSREHAAEQP